MKAATRTPRRREAPVIDLRRRARLILRRQRAVICGLRQKIIKLYIVLAAPGATAVNSSLARSVVKNSAAKESAVKTALHLLVYSRAAAHRLQRFKPGASHSASFIGSACIRADGEKALPYRGAAADRALRVVGRAAGKRSAYICQACRARTSKGPVVRAQQDIRRVRLKRHPPARFSSRSPSASPASPCATTRVIILDRGLEAVRRRAALDVPRRDIAVPPPAAGQDEIHYSPPR